MRKPTLGLAALLMMSGATLAVAQDGPGEKMQAPAQSLERGPTSDGPRGDASGPRGDPAGAGDARNERGAGPDGDGMRVRDRRAEGPNPAARTDPPEGEKSGAKREDRSGARDGDRKMRQQSRGADDDAKGDDAKRDRRGAAQEDGEKSRKAAKSKSDRASDKKDDQAKSDTKSDKQREDNKRAKADDRDDADRSAKSDSTDKGRGGDNDGNRQAERNRDADGDRAAPKRARKVDLSGDKRERVGKALRGDRDVKRRRDVDIDISIGTRLPRDWDYVPVPAAVIDVVPEYDGYVVAYVEDEYVITDPETYEVVAVLPAEEGGPSYAGGSGSGSAAQCSETLTLTDDERRDIVRSIQMTDEADVSDVTVGWSVPDDIELHTFPEPIVERSGKLTACRYFIADDQIAIVDPDEDTVVLLVTPEE